MTYSKPICVTFKGENLVQEVPQIQQQKNQPRDSNNGRGIHTQKRHKSTHRHHTLCVYMYKTFCRCSGTEIGSMVDLDMSLLQIMANFSL